MRTSSRCHNGHIPSKRCLFFAFPVILEGPTRQQNLCFPDRTEPTHPFDPRPVRGEEWWSQSGSNRRPDACKATALPAELWPQTVIASASTLRRTPKMVGLGRLERPTSPLSGVRSNHLSYRPRVIRLASMTMHRSRYPEMRKRNEDGAVPHNGF